MSPEEVGVTGGRGRIITVIVMTVTVVVAVVVIVAMVEMLSWLLHMPRGRA